MKKVIKLLGDCLAYIRGGETVDYESDTPTVLPCLNAMEMRIKEAIAELKTPRWYTPEQWEAETGEVLRDEAILWSRGNCGWGLVKWKHLKDLTDIKKFVMVVVDGPYPPPDGWRPKEPEHDGN